MSESEGELRRPRPIGARDENEEDSDNDRNDPQPARNEAADTAAAAQQAAPEEATKKATSTRRPAFSENDLVKEKGLLQIYERFPEKCKYKGKGREAEFLRGLMVAYKEWGYQLYPGIAFEDLASRTEKLGGRERTRDLMLELRNTERDRVIEAKYGSSAVDDAHAKDAAKAAAKEAAAAEKREKEERAKSRYMDVDQEGPAASTAEGEGSGGEGQGQTTGGADSGGGGGGAVVSEEVRERMEVNRRRAMERLRLKKEETAAAAVTAVAAAAAGAGGAGAQDENEDPQMDIMDEETGWAGEGGEGGDDFEDDEAALAEMEEEDNVAKRTKRVTSDTTSTPSSSAAATPTSGGADSAVEGDTVQQSVETASAVVDTLLEPSERDDEAMGEAEAGDSLATASGLASSLALGGGTVGEVPSSVEAAALDSEQTEGTEAMLDAAGPTNDNVVSPKPPPDSAASPARSTEREESLLAGGEGDSTAPASSGAGTGADDEVAVGAVQATATTTTTTGDGDGEGAVDSSVEQTVFSSPGKLRAPGGVPLSPLGSLFAGTDVPAEGGTAVVVKESLKGLFSDEDL